MARQQRGMEESNKGQKKYTVRSTKCKQHSSRLSWNSWHFAHCVSRNLYLASKEFALILRK